MGCWGEDDVMLIPIKFFVLMIDIDRCAADESKSPAPQRAFSVGCDDNSMNVDDSIKSPEPQRAFGARVNVNKAEPKVKAEKPDEKKADEKPEVEEKTLSVDQQKALDTVLSGRNLFFTGMAGAGKSFTLERIVDALSARGKTGAKRCPLIVAE